MKLSYRIAVVLLSIYPFLRADDTDIGKFGHVVSNRSSHKVHVHADIAGGSDAESWINPGSVWKTGKTRKVNSFEVRDDETGILVEKVKPAEDGGKYQVLDIEPGPNNGKYVGDVSSDKTKARSRYDFKVHRLRDRW